MYQNLRPGGWVELQEFNCNVYYNDGETAKRAVFCTEWIKDLDEASRRFGKKLDVADYQKGWLEEAGFADVTDHTVKVRPLSSSPSSPPHSPFPVLMR